MLRIIVTGLIALLLLGVVACGGGEDEAPAAPAQSSAGQAPAQQAPASGGGTVSGEDALAKYAVSVAGGPGSIFVGDLSQLVGPTRDLDLGLGAEGMIPLDLLEESR